MQNSIFIKSKYLYTFLLLAGSIFYSIFADDMKDILESPSKDWSSETSLQESSNIEDDILQPTHIETVTHTNESASNVAYKKYLSKSQHQSALPVVARDVLLSKLKTALIPVFNSDPTLSIHFSSIPPKIQLENDEFIVKILNMDKVKPSHKVVVMFEVYTSSLTFVGLYSAQLECEILKEALVAVNRIPAGTRLNPSLFSVQSINVLEYNGTNSPLVSNDQSLFNLQSSSTINSKTPLFQKDLEPLSLVKKGDTVEVIVESGLLSLKMKGLALESGAFGQIIKVRNLSSNKVIDAKIIDEKLLEILL